MKADAVDEAVQLASPDPSWAELYGSEVERLSRILQGHSVEHIGSTAVPGLKAKPIVDVMVGVTEAMVVEGLVADLESYGYEDCGGAEGRRYLRLRGRRDVNVQIVEVGGRLWRDNIALREYLRAVPSAAARYAAAKDAALEHAPMLLAYSDAKRPAIEELLLEARERQF